MATKKCPMCAEEIQAEAMVCRYCGARFTTGGEAAAPPPPPEQDAAAATPVGEVREGIVATGLQAFGFITHGLVIEAMLIIVVLSWVGVRALDWGQRSGGYLVEVARPAPIFVIGTLGIALAWAIGVHRLAPRQRDVGSKAVLAFRRATKERGLGVFLGRRGIIAGVVISVLLWAALEASAVWNFTHAADAGWELKFGIYAALVLPVIGALAALLVLGRGRRTVRMDSRGNLFE